MNISSSPARMEVKCPVIALIDLDCFYCQVEHKRQKIPLDVPMVVHQWGSILAVNYPARAFRINRSESVFQVQNQYPMVQSVHVPVLDLEGNIVKHPKPSMKASCKVSLAPYRDESARIMNIISRFSSTTERASIDEAFIDLTEECLKYNDTEAITLVGSNAIDDDNLPSQLEGYDRMLAIGSMIVSSIRRTIFNELGLTCSAGIGHNKMVSKLVCSFQKPNGQTFCRQVSVTKLMKKVNVLHLRFLGGKLGNSLVQLYSQTNSVDVVITPAMILESIPYSTVATTFGESTASWLWDYCKGIDDSKVSLRTLPKTLGASKTLTQALNMDGIKQWLDCLSNEIYERVRKDMEPNKRRPTILNLQAFSMNRSCGIPLPTRDSIDRYTLTKEVILSLSLRLLNQMDVGNEKCSYVSITCKSFVDIDDGDTNILSFMSKPIHDLTLTPSNWCQRCNIAFTSTCQHQMHMDEHFAHDLSDIERSKAELRIRKPTSKEHPSLKKKKNQKNTIHKYFT